MKNRLIVNGILDVITHIPSNNLSYSKAIKAFILLGQKLGHDIEDKNTNYAEIEATFSYVMCRVLDDIHAGTEILSELLEAIPFLEKTYANDCLMEVLQAKDNIDRVELSNVDKEVIVYARNLFASVNKARPA
ncbi:hypothetical protein VCSRO97_3338 [Vibrio cholerae]|nr:hypothetical protein VCSRO97_3338 [Vibrio cholerae]